MGKLIQVLQDSLTKIITGLVVAGVTAAFLTSRDWLWRVATADVAVPAWLLLLAVVVIAAIASFATYGLLLKTIRQGRIDRTTQVPVSGEIDPFLDKRLKDAKQAEKSFCCILVDVDEFKRVNDQYNHEVGNQTLLEVAQMITPRSPEEKIFRYGGDEFLIVSKLGMNEVGTWAFANRLIVDVAQKEFSGDINKDRIHLTISCGAVLCDGSETRKQTRDRLVKALKIAKARGKNRAYLFEASDEQGGEPVRT